jgi:hypothetical protein
MISGFRELDTWIRLDLPNEELDSFLRNACCKEPLKKSDPKKHTPGDLAPDWWKPHEAIYLEECTGLHENLYQSILVDRSKPEILTIYVFSITQNYTDTITPTITP